MRSPFLSSSHKVHLWSAKTKRTLKIDFLLLSLLWSGHLLANLWWLKTDTRPPYYDSAGHSVVAIYLSRLSFLTDPRSALEGILSVGPYPPLTYLAAVPFAYWFWPTTDVFAGSLVFFLAILLGSTYSIGYHIGGRRAGLLSSLFVSMYPILYGLSRHYLLDVPLVAIVAFSVSCLLFTRVFQSFWLSLLFGLSLGAGMLTKWTFAIFVCGPLLFVLLQLIKQSTWKQWRNLLLSSLLGVVICSAWYINHAEDLMKFLQIGGFQAAAVEGDPRVGTWHSWTYYLVQLLEHQTLAPFALLFCVGLIQSFIKPNTRYAVAPLLAWILIPYLVFANYTNKDIRYTVPSLPALAVITGIGISSISATWLRRSVLVVVVVYAIVQFVGLTVGISQRLGAYLQITLPARLALSVGALSIPLYSEYVHIATPPRKEEWPVQTVLHDVFEDKRRSFATEMRLKMTVIPNIPCFEAQGFVYQAEVERLPIDITYITGILPIDSTAQLITSDYVVTKNGDQGPVWTLQDAVEITESIHNLSSRQDSQYQLLHTYPLPDGSTAYLYKHLAKLR